MFAMIGALVTSGAQAQTTTTTTTTTTATATATTTAARVDPAYLEYLAFLAEVATPNTITTEPQYQLFPGMVGFRDLNDNPLGTVFVTGTWPNLKEVWYLDAMQDPDAGFVLEHTGQGFQIGLEAQELDAGWDQRPCYVMAANYLDFPVPALTGKLQEAGNMDRYAFELYQDGDILTGRLLREFHHVPNMPEQFVDHWVFFDNYELPKLMDQSTSVEPTGVAYANAAAFFADVSAQQDPMNPIWKYAQIQYKELLGYQCVGGLK